MFTIIRVNAYTGEQTFVRSPHASRPIQLGCREGAVGVAEVLQYNEQEDGIVYVVRPLPTYPGEKVARKDVNS